MTIEHRRRDGELLGVLVPERGGFVALDRLGRRITEPVDHERAEAALEERGLAYLADAYELESADGSVHRVRIVEVLPDRVLVKQEDFGAIDAPQRLWTLPNPIPGTLRPR